ncbi:hypothetical protein BU16DRAFT_1232 [Lophium mytilinum]|uniref:Extracellular membrane protein CFEM domain-containing protein n=1 Tax=Lophium mytilinum TaxID=390894 RepID=A0A6A6RBI8_9PEZI|nr:hypothetical protein BU16DRAFT_1232 [Lophium mytilinum]
MRLPHLLPTTFLALASADSIALSSFTPRISSLPPACDKVYNAPIANCASTDFQSTCSPACIAGLVAISKAVAASCAHVDVAETSIIGVFLLGQGIPALCSNTVVTTVGSSDAPAQSTSAVQTSSSSSSRSSSKAESSSAGIIVDPSATPAKPSSTLSTAVSSAVSSEAAASSSAAVVTSAPAATASSTASFGLSSSTSTSTAEAPKKSGKSQLSNSSSGGGSPFDVQATGDSPRQAPRGILALFIGVVGMLVMVR